jgi:hypothetical protein
VSYYRDVGLQRIHLQGQVKNGTVGATIFTLPTGYRPETLRRFVVEAVGGTTGVGTLTIASTGAVTLTSGSNTLVSLDGVSFRAA